MELLKWYELNVQKNVESVQAAEQARGSRSRPTQNAHLKSAQVADERSGAWVAAKGYWTYFAWPAVLV